MLWSKLITKKLSCPKYGGEKGEMTCTMDMESYGHTADDYYYELKDGDKSFAAGCNFSRKFNEIFLTIELHDWVWSKSFGAGCHFSAENHVFLKKHF
jgi:hypothetical protein